MSVIDQVIKTYVSADLKAEGFKKTRRRWNRERGDFIDVIAFQSAGGSPKVGHEQFTIELGVGVPMFDRIIWPNIPPKPVFDEIKCAVRLRLRNLINKHQPASDYISDWWDVAEDGSNIELIGKEVGDALRDLAVPFLGSFTDYQIMCDYLRTDRHDFWGKLHHSLAEWKAGNKSEALAILDSLNVKGTEGVVKNVRDAINS